eukprot:XP_019919479.1 PREDICTED: uncharacterized protein LOC109617581 [Crassostrea gigas]
MVVSLGRKGTRSTFQSHSCGNPNLFLVAKCHERLRVPYSTDSAPYGSKRLGTTFQLSCTNEKTLWVSFALQDLVFSKVKNYIFPKIVLGNFGALPPYRRTIEMEREESEWRSWDEASIVAVSRDGWRRSVDALCATRQKADRSRSRATSVLELHEILKGV